MRPGERFVWIITLTAALGVLAWFAIQLAEPAEPSVLVCELGQLKQCQANLSDTRAELTNGIGHFEVMLDSARTATQEIMEEYAKCESRWSNRPSCQWPAPQTVQRLQ